MVPLGGYNNDLIVGRGRGRRMGVAHFINADQIEIVFCLPPPLGVLTFGFYSELPEWGIWTYSCCLS